MDRLCKFTQFKHNLIRNVAPNYFPEAPFVRLVQFCITNKGYYKEFAIWEGGVDQSVTIDRNYSLQVEGSVLVRTFTPAAPPSTTITQRNFVCKRSSFAESTFAMSVLADKKLWPLSAVAAFPKKIVLFIRRWRSYSVRKKVLKLLAKPRPVPKLNY